MRIIEEGRAIGAIFKEIGSTGKSVEGRVAKTAIGIAWKPLTPIAYFTDRVLKHRDPQQIIDGIEAVNKPLRHDIGGWGRRGKSRTV